jgi:hypothetical protein
MKDMSFINSCSTLGNSRWLPSTAWTRRVGFYVIKNLSLTSDLYCPRAESCPAHLPLTLTVETVEKE